MMANVDQLKSVDKIQGSSFLAIHAAMPVVKRRQIDLTRCTVQVFRSANSAVVVFTIHEQLGERHIAVRQGSDVELNAAELAALTSKTDEIQLLDTIQGSSVRPIETAIEVFQRHNPPLDCYNIELMREKTSLIVVFTDKEAQGGGRGGRGKRPGFEVELHPPELRVLRSNFVR